MSEKSESTFSLRYTVTKRISAPPSAVWAKLTDARGFSKWNSTVESIEGVIALGQTITIRVPFAPGRRFAPKVVEFAPDARMVWRDGFYPMFEGTRTFSLTPKDGGTEFEMVEHFRGVMLPMIKGSLPDFAPIFDRYAEDLKKACEASTGLHAAALDPAMRSPG